MTIAELFAKLTIKPDKRSFDAADKLLSGIKTALLAIVAVKTGQFFAGMVEDTTELGGKLNDMAIASGTDVESLQELAYAAAQSGGSLEGVNTTLIKLSKNIFEATHGNKEMAKSFARAGIAVRNADGSLRPAEDVLADIGDHLSSMPEGTEKTATAIELLGKAGADQLPWLNENLGKLRQEAHDLGGVIDADAITALDEFGDTQGRVKTALTGLRNEAVIALLPALQEMATGLLEWVKANRELIKQKLQSVIKFIAGALKMLAKVVGFVIDVIGFLGDHLDLVVVGVLSLVTAIGIFKAASIAAAIASGVAWAIAHLPILLLIAAIAAVILIVEDLYQWFTGGESVLKDLYNSALQYLNWDVIAEKIKNAFSAALDWVKQKAQEAWAAITGSVNFDDMSRRFAERLHNEGKISDEEYEHAQRFGLGGGTIGEEVDYAQGRFQTPRIDIPATEQVSNGPTFSAQFQIDGSKSPEATAQAVNTALETFWSAQMRKAAAQSGSKR